MNTKGTRPVASVALLGGLAATLIIVASCAPETPPSLGRTATGRAPLPALTPAPNVPGNPENGRRLFTDTQVFPPNGCGFCHTIRGVPEATGVFGPNLTNVALRPTLAGDAIPNTPENMAKWIMDPPLLKQGTLMPKLNMTAEQARDVAAFLYSQPHNPSAQ